MKKIYLTLLISVFLNFTLKASEAKIQKPDKLALQEEATRKPASVENQKTQGFETQKIPFTMNPEFEQNRKTIDKLLLN